MNMRQYKKRIDWLVGGSRDLNRKEKKIMKFKITLCPLSEEKGVGGVNGKGDCFNRGELEGARRWGGKYSCRSQGEKGKSIKKRLGGEGDGMGEGGEERS
jgi:hypothetical protein